MPLAIPLRFESSSIIGLLAGLDVLLNWDLRQYLPQLSMSVLYIFGRLDAITSRTTMTVMQKLYPRFIYKMFAQAAHVPFLSHPEEFVVALDDFLS